MRLSRAQIYELIEGYWAGPTVWELGGQFGLQDSQARGRAASPTIFLRPEEVSGAVRGVLSGPLVPIHKRGS